MTALDGKPDAPRVNLYVIESTMDEVVTPYQSAFLPTTENVQNVTLQNQCPTDLTDHIGMIYDPVAHQDVIAALGNNSRTALPLPGPRLPAGSSPADQRLNSPSSTVTSRRQIVRGANYRDEPKLGGPPPARKILRG